MFTFLEVVALLIILLVISSIYWYATIPKNLPPGPPGIPFLGNALDYSQSTDQHFIVLEHIRKYGPIFKLYMANKLLIVLGDYETIQEALVKQGDVFAGRPQIMALMPEKMIGHGVIMTEGELWKEQRRFALSTLRDFGIGRPIIEPRIKEEIDHLSERLTTLAEEKRPFDAQGLLTCAVSNIISQLLFGRRFDYEDKEFVRQFYLLSQRIAGTQVGFMSPFMFSDRLASLVKHLPVIRRMQKEVDEFVEFTECETNRVIKEFDPLSEPSNYIHAYLKAANDRQGENFTDVQLQSTVVDLFLAGTETTSTTTRYALLLLATYPDIQERMFREIKDEVGVDSLPDYADRTKLPYCEATVNEVQRVANLAPFGVARRTLAKTKLMGYDIPEDAIIVPFLTGVLHNEKIFEDATKFRPERFLDESGEKVVKEPKMIPFQAGKRICLGEALARMELFLLMVGLVSRFRFYFRDDQPKPTLKPIVGILTAPRPYQVYIEKR